MFNIIKDIFSSTFSLEFCYEVNSKGWKYLWFIVLIKMTKNDGSKSKRWIFLFKKLTGHNIYCFVGRPSHIWCFGVGFFLWTGTRKGTNMSKGPVNLLKFHRRNRDKCCSKDSHFLCRKTLRNEIELRQDQYHSMRKLSNLSQSVAFWQSLLSVDVFFRRRRPMNNLELTPNSQVYITNKN